MPTADSSANVAVLGAGSWGTALALLLSQRCAVRLWDRNAGLVSALHADRQNRRYLPEIGIPDGVRAISDIATTLREVSCVVVAVPSGAVREVLDHVRPFLAPGIDIVLAAKGLEPETGLLPCEVAEGILSPARFSLVALSGPNLAGEVARGIPAAAVSACPDSDAAERVALLFNRQTFRVYSSSDRVGVELGGAVKNVLAIAGGVSDGLGFGDNAKAALLTRGLAEMTRLGVACGARAETFYGLAGVGDLMATAASRLSRNWRVGAGLAIGEPLDSVLSRLGQVAEGVPTARAVVQIAERRGIDMPVCSAVAAMLFDGLAPSDAVGTLLGRAHRSEFD